MKKGLKYDALKPRYDLLPIYPLKKVVEVLSYGAEKYSDNNWKRVRPKSRYYRAALGHLFDYGNGERNDEESRLPHLAHATCCLLFLLWMERRLK